MKKILFGLSVFFTTLVSAQNFPDYYPNNNTTYNNDDYDDEMYFPDDYYYEYPSDYYTNDLYEGYYNDYRRSIADVNWNRFFSQYRLSPWQIQEIIMLNNQFASYSSWNSYYRFNPDRWYYDRFYALQNIMGPQVFVVFQNNFYNGYNPVIYYQNYRRQHYVTNIYVIPRYRKVNVNRYRIDRNLYHQNNPRTHMGFNNSPRNGNGNWQNNSNNGGFRNETTAPSNPRSNGFRNEAESLRPAPNTANNGIRNNSERSKVESNRPKNSEGPRRDSGFRNSSPTPQRKVERNLNQQKAPASIRSSKSSGLRFTSNQR